MHTYKANMTATVNEKTLKNQDSDRSNLSRASSARSNVSRSRSRPEANSSRAGTTLRASRLNTSPSKAALKGDGAAMKDTINTVADRAFTKDGQEVCKWVKPSTVK